MQRSLQQLIFQFLNLKFIKFKHFITLVSEIMAEFMLEDEESPGMRATTKGPFKNILAELRLLSQTEKDNELIKRFR